MNRLLAIAIGVLTVAWSDRAESNETVDVLRDRYGVPHVFAQSVYGAWYGMGWVAAEDGAESVILDMLAAQGRLTELEWWNEQSTHDRDSGYHDDVTARALRHAEHATAGYGRLSSDVRDAIEGWTAGFVEYVGTHPEWPYQVLQWEEVVALRGEIDSTWPVAWVLWLNTRNAIKHMSDLEKRAFYDPSDYRGASAGASNMAAVHDLGTPDDLGTFLYGDPHIQWRGGQRRIGLHVADRASYAFTGVAELFLGGGIYDGVFAVAATNNFPDPGDAFAEVMTYLPEDPQPYRYDDYLLGEAVPLHFIDETLRPVWEGGSTTTVRLFYSRRGWIPHATTTELEQWNETSEFLSVRIAVDDVMNADDDAHPIDFVEQRMQQAWAALYPDPVGRTLALSHSPWNSHRSRVSADLDDVLYAWTGRVPLRPDLARSYTVPAPQSDAAAEWQGVDPVPMECSATPSLPHVLNPHTDIPGAYWVQNSNDAPWYAASGGSPQQTLYPCLGRLATTPPWIVDGGSNGRGLRMAELLDMSPIFLEEDAKKVAFDVVCYDARESLKAMDAHWQGNPGLVEQELSQQPPELRPFIEELHVRLSAWAHAGGEALKESTGMTLVQYFAETIARWPGELDDLETYVSDLAATVLVIGSVYCETPPCDLPDVPWGDVHYMLVPDPRGGEPVPYPLDGGTKQCPTLFLAHNTAGFNGGDRIVCNAGSSHIHAHFLDPEAPRSFSVAPVGQIDPAYFPTSPHLPQQAALFAARDWEENWLTRKAVEEHPCEWGEDPDHEHRTLTVLEVTR